MATNYPTRNQKGRNTRTPVVVETPDIEEHPPEEKDAKYLDFPNGARYKVAGNCAICGIELYDCLTYPIVDLSLQKSVTRAVFVPNSRPAFPTRDTIPQKPTVYCQEHDPTRSMRNRHGKKLEGGATVDGDSWAPLR
jgi:hypothetical protein